MVWLGQTHPLQAPSLDSTPQPIPFPSVTPRHLSLLSPAPLFLFHSLSPSIFHGSSSQRERAKQFMPLLDPILPVPMAMGSVPSLVPVPFLLMSCVRLFKKKNECGCSHLEITFLEAASSA